MKNFFTGVLVILGAVSTALTLGMIVKGNSNGLFTAIVALLLFVGAGLVQSDL